MKYKGGLMTFRSPNKKIELEGVRYVEGIVQNSESIFRHFDKDDQGNDCYVEFVVNGLTTNYGIFAQIKSGKTYKDKMGYKIPANNAHIKYWNQPLYKSIGIVYDPEIKKAFWVDFQSISRIILKF